MSEALGGGQPGTVWKQLLSHWSEVFQADVYGTFGLERDAMALTGIISIFTRLSGDGSGYSPHVTDEGSEGDTGARVIFLGSHRHFKRVSIQSHFYAEIKDLNEIPKTKEPKDLISFSQKVSEDGLQCMSHNPFH